MAWEFVAMTDVRSAYSDQDRARFICSLTKSNRVMLNHKGACSNDWREEAAGDLTYGHVYEKVLYHGKKQEED